MVFVFLVTGYWFLGMGKSLLISVLLLFPYFYSIFVSFLGLRYLMVIIIITFYNLLIGVLRLVIFFICLMSRLVLYYYHLFFI